VVALKRMYQLIDMAYKIVVLDMLLSMVCLILFIYPPLTRLILQPQLIQAASKLQRAHWIDFSLLSTLSSNGIKRVKRIQGIAMVPFICVQFVQKIFDEGIALDKACKDSPRNM